jgi:signal transduction histidine kinase
VIETLVAVARRQADPRSVTSDAHEVATAVVASVRGAGRSDVELALRTPPPGLRLGVDRDLAERVVAPIVANALRYADALVAVEVRGTDGVVEFVVTDDGPGVRAGESDAIFRPGYRGQPPPGQAARRDDGAGLGLALARRLAEAAGGDVKVQRDAGGGARFVVSLPSA